MIHVRLVERIDGTWCAYVEGQEDDAVVAPADDAALGRLVRGQARRFGIDPWPARLLFVLILLAIPGSQIVIYPILWIVMPSQTAADAFPASGLR